MLSEIREICWPLSLALLALWALQIFRFRLAKRYPALVTYLLSALGFGVGGFVLDQLRHSAWLGRSAYFWYWATLQPLLWLLLAAMLFECFSRMTEDYQSLRRLGRWVAFGLAGGVLAIMGLVVVFDPFAKPDPKFWNSVLLIQQQSIYFATAASVLLLLGIRRFFRLPVPRNVQTIVGVFGVYFISVAAMMAIRSYVGYVSNEMNYAVDVAGLVIYCGCILYGAMSFSPRGEEVARDPRLDASTADALRSAAGRMQEVNAQLMKVVVK